jgi:transcriptional regulator with XRE-family HTH domain
MESATLPVALRARMMVKSHTQQQAADAMKTSGANVNRWISGAEPKADFYESLCDYLDVTMAELGALIIETEFQKYRQQ